MKSFYLKNQNGKYCILAQTQVDMDAIFLLDIYIGKFQQQLPDDIQEAFDTLTECGGFWGKKEYWNGGDISKYTSFFINLLSFKQVPLKNSSHETDKYTLNEVSENFKNLFKLQEKYQIITQFLLKNKTQFESLMPDDVKKYTPFRAHEFDLKKPYFKQVKFNSLLKPSFDTLVKSWQTVLDTQGVPFDMEENSFAAKFNEKEGYALFCNDQYSADVKNSGFWGSTNSSLTDINQAKLFQSEAQIERYIKSGGFSNVAVVKVNVKFTEVVKSYGKINITPLETAKAEQEKNYLESLMTNREEVKDLATKLLSVCSHDNLVLKAELEKLIEKQNSLPLEKVETVKAKKKI